MKHLVLSQRWADPFRHAPSLVWLLVSGLAVLVAVACSSDSPNELDPSGAPTTPTETLCESSSDCAAGLVCDPLQGCRECVFDTHCPDGSRCAAGTCEAAVACSTSEDCPASVPFCDPVARTCAICFFDQDCGENARCVDGGCSAYQPCENTFDCAEGSVCARDLGECVACVADADCALPGEEESSFACAANVCLKKCDSDNDCRPLGQLCNLAAGHCAGCVQDTDCPDLYHCDSGACVVDVCEAGETSCEGGRVHLCNGRGDGFEVVDCPGGSSCVQKEGEPATCAPWNCQPNADFCDATNQHARCSLDGQTAELVEDCAAAGKTCDAGACVEPVCEAEEYHCEGSHLFRCNASGSDAAIVQSCADHQYCSAEGKVCRLRTCTTGETRCGEEGIETCKPDGSGFEVTTKCAEDEACELPMVFPPTSLVCAEKVCEPFAYECTGGSSRRRCNATGTGYSSSESCNSGYSSQYYCEDGACKQRSCSPNQPICDGEVATVCNAVGSGPTTSAGTDCAEQGMACHDGLCREKVCEMGTDGCDGQGVVRCTDNGTRQYVVRTCNSSSYCDAGHCRSRLCTPDERVCDGNAARTCNSIGSGYLDQSTDCTTTEQVCWSGACLDEVCSPGERLCQGGNVYDCTGNGALTSLYDSCSASEHCFDPGPGESASCRTDVCAHGQPACDGAVATTCNADGSGYLPGGTDCADTDQVCVGGSCRDVICTAGAERCDASTTKVETCVDQGSAWSVVRTCATSQHCGVVSGTDYDCVVDVCDAGLTACDGERAATCTAAGSGWTDHGVDCGATDQVCAADQSCVDEAVDTMGRTTSSILDSGTYLGLNGYRVDRPRRLREIEQYVSYDGTSLVRFLVYVKGAGSTYTKDWELVTTRPLSGAGYVSSGDIDYALEAGKEYLIGAQVEGTVRFYDSCSSSYSYYCSLPGPYSSFGKLLGAATWSSTGVPATISLAKTWEAFGQRLTTGPASD